MARRKKYPKLPNGYGSIKRLSGKNRANPYGVYPPTKEFDENGNPVPVKALCYVDDWMKGFIILTAYKAGTYKLGGGVIDPLPADAPFFVKDYYDYYKTKRGYHPRSLNSNGGWNVTGTMSFLNQPILAYSNEIRSAVLIIHGEKAHSVYFSKDAYKNMINGNPYTENKELLIIPGAVHTDLYDGGGKNAIPFDKIENFFDKYLK